MHGKSHGAGSRAAVPLRVGLIGPGRVAAAHIGAIRLLEAERIATLLGVVGRTPDRGREAAARFGTGSYPTVEALLEAGVDMVHVTTPNRAHEACLRTITSSGWARPGRGLIVEKPLGLGATETGWMLRGVGASGLIHATQLQRRFRRQVQTMRELIASGEFGRPRVLRLHYLQDWTAVPADDDWRMDAAQGGAIRAVLDLGPHVFDLAGYVTGQQILDVQAMLGATVTHAHRRPLANDVAMVTFRMSGEVLGQVTISQASHGHDELRVEVDCDRASLVWSESNPTVLQILRRGADPDIRVAEDEDDIDVFAALAREVYAAVAGDTERSYPDFGAGHEQALIIDAIVRSAAQRRTVRVAR
jgi:predicted dehydrogenase